ncbi:MAG: RNHCP domain-containing protein [Omnitrophica WOR_2 bacterium]
MKSKHRENRSNPARNGFRCAHCHLFVSTQSVVSGVQNRNHCPFCLWSLHVDTAKAGDRLAACKSQMKPIGLTTKKIIKKYGGNIPGELMLIHLCTGCGKVSINRIAADDSSVAIYQVYTGSFDMNPTLLENLISSGIQPLRLEDKEMVRTQLFGYSNVTED